MTGFPVKRGRSSTVAAGGCNRITGSQPEQQDWLFVSTGSGLWCSYSTGRVWILLRTDLAFFVIRVSRKLLTVSPHSSTRPLLLPEQYCTGRRHCV